MPRYEYKCRSCGKEADVICRISEMETTKPDELLNCCEKPDPERQIKTANFQLKGPGWFRDGY